MTNEQFDTILTNKETKIIILSTTWCAPCKMLSKTVDKIKKENSDFESKIIKIDVDEDQDLAQRFEIMSVPTVLFVKNGAVDIARGNQSESVLVDWFN